MKYLKNIKHIFKTITKNKSNLFLYLAIFASFVLRFWKLGKLPFPPDGDELAFGYYGWSLLRYGTDEYGNFLPFNFLSIGDFKYPGLAYLNIIPTLLFGLNEFSVRFLSALSGVLLVPLVYSLVNYLLSNKKIALYSAWFIALSPWDILESRLGYENHISLTLTLLGFFFLLIGLEKKRQKILSIKFNPPNDTKKFILISLFLFLLSSFTYAAQRIFIPLMMVVLYLITLNLKSVSQKGRKMLIGIFIVYIFSIGLSLLPKTGRGRAAEESWKGITYEQKDRQQQLIVQAGISPVRTPVLFTRIMHNKYRIALYDLLSNYADHFSPDFLFFKGELGGQKIPDMGVLLMIEIILFPTGLFLLFFKGIDYKKTFILSWLLISPVASSLTFGGAHINRASNMIVPIGIFSAIGFYYLTNIFKGFKNYFVSAILISGIVWSFFYSFGQLFVHKVVDNPWKKEQVFKEVALKVLEYSKKYEAVVLGDDDYIYFLFYGKISPKEFINNSVIEPFSFEKRWERVKSFKNIYFLMPYECPKSGKLGVAYVCSGANVPQNAKILDVFYYKDGVPAFSIIEFTPISMMSSSLPILPDRFFYMVDIERREDFPDGIIPVSYYGFW